MYPGHSVCLRHALGGPHDHTLRRRREALDRSATSGAPRHRTARRTWAALQRAEAVDRGISQRMLALTAAPSSTTATDWTRERNGHDRRVVPLGDRGSDPVPHRRSPGGAAPTWPTPDEAGQAARRSPTKRSSDPLLIRSCRWTYRAKEGTGEEGRTPDQPPRAIRRHQRRAHDHPRRRGRRRPSRAPCGSGRSATRCARPRSPRTSACGPCSSPPTSSTTSRPFPRRARPSSTPRSSTACRGTTSSG